MKKVPVRIITPSVKKYEHNPTLHSAKNVIDNLLEFGVEHELLIRKYVNVPVLEKDTNALLKKVKQPLASYKEQITLERVLIKMWFPSLLSLDENGVCEFSDMFDICTEVRSILTNEGYIRADDDDNSDDNDDSDDGTN